MDKGTTVAQFTITAQSAQVVAESIQLEVLAITPSGGGQEFSCGGGDILPGRFLDVTLDNGHIDFYYGSDDSDEVRHSPFGLLVKPGSAEKIQVLAHFKDDSGENGGQQYSWRLKLNYLVNGSKYAKLIDNDGLPFITVT